MRKNLFSWQSYLCRARSWHYGLATFLLLLSVGINAQAVATQTFTADGYDDENFELSINSADITVNDGATIQNITVDGFLAHYNSPTGSTTGCSTYNWYGFDMSITGGVADGFSVTEGCSADIDGTDITGFTEMTFTAVDTDNYADHVYIEVILSVTYEGEFVPTYCTPSYSSNLGDNIESFELEGISNTASGFSTGGYGDYTSMSTDLAAGQDYTATLTSGDGSGSHGAAIWIDFGDDGDFDESDRVGFASGITAEQATEIQISIPADAASGEHRMRVVYQWNVAGDAINPCASASFGEGEDYTVNVTGGTVDPEPGDGCEWTVHVWDDYFGDEVEWELRDSDGNALISGGGYDDGYDDVQTVTAEGPLTFWITNDGFYADNEANYEVSNENGVIVAGQMPEGGATSEFDNLNCTDEALETCSGTPDGGTITGSPASGPSGTVVHFVATGFTTGSLGLTYDWQYYDDVAGVWVGIGVAASDVYLTATGPDGAELLVRYAVTCANSGESGYSNEFTFTIDESVCLPSFTSSGDHIENFELEDIQNIGSGFTPGGYGDFTSMSTDLEAGQTYTASLTSASGSGNHAAAAWVDFNDDGQYDESERVGTADGIAPSTTADLSIAIPADAAEGAHVLRVIYQYGTDLVGTDIDPCVSGTWGEGEDYTVNITGGTVDPEPVDYCTPEGTNVNRYINNFSTTGGSENISNMGSGFSDGGYGDFYETMGVTQIQGQSVDFVVDIEGGIAGFRVWVDWNQDGEFDTTEEVAYQSVAYEDTQEGSITVPTDALLGDTRMRVVSHWLSTTGNVDPCATGFVYGEFEDYRFTVEAMADCSGTPEGGAVTVDPEEGNMGSEYTVSATGYTIAGGMSYQWQSNTDEAGWVDEGTASATYADYTATAPSELDVVVEWRLAVTCVSSDETVYSDTASFTTIMEYCTPDFSNSTDYITDFELEDIQNNASGFSTNGYGDFTSMSTDLAAGTTYTASLSSSTGSGNHAAAIWIDFDNNGTFDVSERVGTADGIQPSTTVDVPVAIPADAAAGEHRMRVVYQWNVAGDAINPCASASFGEGEDYTVNITEAPEPGDGCFVTGVFDQYPSTTFIPSCIGTMETITTAAWAGEYSKVQVSAGTEYIFSSSVATDYITIAEENEDITLATGTGSVTWTAPTDQVIRFYTHADEDCTIEELARARNVQCGDIPPTPANDDCENAIALACGDTDSGSTVGATNSGGNDAGDVFYTFTGTGTEEMVTVSLCGSTYDTTVRVFSDCTLGTEIAFNDDAGAGDCAGTLQSEVTFLSDGTSTYVIMVEGYSSNVGNYEIAVSCALPPSEPDYGCDQTYDEGIFDLANSISGDLGYTVANDFFVPMDSEVYQIESVSLLLLPIAGSDADFDTFDISILSDNAATPGTPVDGASWTGLTGTSELYPELFAGYNTYMVTIDLDGFELPVDAGADTRYWIQVTAYSASAQNIFWVGYPYTEGWNTASNYQSEDGGATWTQITYDGVGDHYESFWSIDANCELGVSDMNSFDFTYYPNPVKDYLTIDAKNPIVNINVHNLAGQTVMQNVQLKEGKLNMSNLSSGVYVFRVTLEGGQIETFKVIKK